jgi:hypothetical protein
VDDELPVDYDLNFHSGDDVGREVIYTEGFTVVDLTGFTIQWRITMDDLTSAIYVDGDGLVVDPLLGSITLQLEGPDDTIDFVGRGIHILQITAPYRKTLLMGDVYAQLDEVSFP